MHVYEFNAAIFMWGFGNTDTHWHTSRNTQTVTCTSTVHRDVVYQILNSVNTSEDTLSTWQTFMCHRVSSFLILIYLVRFTHLHTRRRRNNPLAQYTDCQMHLGMGHQARQKPQEIFWCPHFIKITLVEMNSVWKKLLEKCITWTQ